MNRDEVEAQIAEFRKALERKAAQADADQLKFVTRSCAKIEQTAKELMRDTIVNPEVSYGPKKHHPSMAGEAPAVDTGLLRMSVTHSVDVDSGGNVTGSVGSILQNPDYPRYLEYGTSKMKPRPWLSAALMKCQSWMAQLFGEIFGK